MKLSKNQQVKQGKVVETGIKASTFAVGKCALEALLPHQTYAKLKL